uniref:Uncharacterized protein n=1 Tax=Oryza glumipatula TaxID=40148 RepID=A0A0D9Y8T0_9ORYZ
MTTVTSSPTRSMASSPTTPCPSMTSSQRRTKTKRGRSTALFLTLPCPSCLDTGQSFPRIAAMALSSACTRIIREMNPTTWSTTLPLRDGSSCPRSTV